MEIKKNSNKMKIIVILGIIILPVVYSLFYLKGFWDPYNSLGEVSVAVVNQDECTDSCMGKELVKQLKDSDTFDFKVVSEKKADDGLVNKDYYAIIKIPKDFSSSFESANTKDRKQATITFKPNTKTNYIVSQILTTAMNKVESKLENEVSKEVTKELVDNLQSVPDQTKQISNGLGTIYDGAKQLSDGSNTLNAGINTLNTSYMAFNNGVEKLAVGSNTLYTSYQTMDNGINTLYDSVHNTLIPQVNQSMSNLSTGVSQLKTGSNTLNNKLETINYKQKMNKFMNDTAEVYNALSQMCNAGMLQNEKLCEAAIGYTKVNETGQTNIATLQNGTNSLVDGAANLNNGINSLASSLSGVSTLTSGLQTLDESILKLKNGSSEVLTGIESLNNGLNTLNSSSKEVQSGIKSLSTGSNTLTSGLNTLKDGTKSAKTQVDEKITETEDKVSQLDGLDNYTKDSVKIKEKDYGEVDDYGTFFSPYFMSLSLWVGGLLILMGLYYDPDHRFKTLGRNSESRGKRLFYYNVIGILQAILLAFILQITLGFEVTNNLVFYGSCILISEAFLAIIMFLFFNFQDIGKFLSLVFLVLQLASCGGTFPVQTEPALYQAIYPFMPMTYSVDLLRESFVSINSEFLTKDLLIMFGIIVVFNLLIFITSYLKSKKEKTTNNSKKVTGTKNSSKNKKHK